MGFQIVELEMDGEDVRNRKVVPYPFPTFGEAKLRVQHAISKYAEYGYGEERAFWWFRTFNGESSRMVIEHV